MWTWLALQVNAGVDGGVNAGVVNAGVVNAGVVNAGVDGGMPDVWLSSGARAGLGTLKVLGSMNFNPDLFPDAHCVP